jgi:hypothetical protein
MPYIVTDCMVDIVFTFLYHIDCVIDIVFQSFKDENKFNQGTTEAAC